MNYLICGGIIVLIIVIAWYLLYKHMGNSPRF